MPSSQTAVLRDPRQLFPHPQNERIYGRPQDNDQYASMVRSMKNDGYDHDHPLTIAPDNRVLAGCTRHAAALAAKVAEVPCHVFTPSGPEAAEDEFLEVLLKDNQYRQKTNYMLAREWQLRIHG